MLHKNTELQIANSKFPMNVRFRGNFFVIFQFALIDYWKFQITMSCENLRNVKSYQKFLDL